MQKTVSDGTRKTLTGTFDGHGHLRRNKKRMMQTVAQDVLAEFCGMVVMPNPKPPITTTDLALEYAGEISSAAPQRDNPRFNWVLTCYLTDETKADDVIRGVEEDIWQAVKYMPANGSTNTAHAVTSIERIYPLLEKLEEYTRQNGRKKKIPVLWHGETVGENIDPFDSERVFMEKDLPPVRKCFPNLPIVLEHITTREAAWFVEEDKGPTWATLTPQHLLFDRSRIFQRGTVAAGTFERGFFPSMVCWPLLKEKKDREALLALIKGPARKRVGLGTDRAPHDYEEAKVPTKECGAGGCYPWRVALGMYAMAHEEAGALDYLEDFACRNIPIAVYELPQGQNEIVLVKSAASPIEIPGWIEIEDGFIVPMLHGEKTPWRIETSE